MEYININRKEEPMAQYQSIPGQHPQIPPQIPSQNPMSPYPSPYGQPPPQQIIPIPMPPMESPPNELVIHSKMKKYKNWIKCVSVLLIGFGVLQVIHCLFAYAAINGVSEEMQEAMEEADFEVDIDQDMVFFAGLLTVGIALCILCQGISGWNAVKVPDPVASRRHLRTSRRCIFVICILYFFKVLIDIDICEAFSQAIQNQAYKLPAVAQAFQNHILEEDGNPPNFIFIHMNGTYDEGVVYVKTGVNGSTIYYYDPLNTTKSNNGSLPDVDFHPEYYPVKGSMDSTIDYEENDEYWDDDESWEEDEDDDDQKLPPIDKTDNSMIKVLREIEFVEEQLGNVDKSKKDEDSEDEEEGIGEMNKTRSLHDSKNKWNKHKIHGKTREEKYNKHKYNNKNDTNFETFMENDEDWEDWERGPVVVDVQDLKRHVAHLIMGCYFAALVCNIVITSCCCCCYMMCNRRYHAACKCNIYSYIYIHSECKNISTKCAGLWNAFRQPDARPSKLSTSSNARQATVNIYIL